MPVTCLVINDTLFSLTHLYFKVHEDTLLANLVVNVVSRVLLSSCFVCFCGDPETLKKAMALPLPSFFFITLIPLVALTYTVDAHKY